MIDETETVDGRFEVELAHERSEQEIEKHCVKESKQHHVGSSCPAVVSSCPATFLLCVC